MNMDGNAPINHLAQAVQDKRPVPEIDFTLHTMEDGNQVSTQERVCKGRVNSEFMEVLLLTCLPRCPSASLSPSQ